MKNDLISVIVTVYNNMNYISQCLESLREQTYKNFEAIIIDDGSTDGSAIILDSFSSDIRFRIIHSEHLGFTFAKNKGLDEARGDWIIFLDSDDFVHPQWLEMLHAAAVFSGADIAICNYDKFTDIPLKDKIFELTSVRLTFYDRGKMLLPFKTCSLSYMWNKMFKKELWSGIRFRPMLALSDLAECYKLIDAANFVVFVHSPLIHYRQHQASMSKQTRTLGRDYWLFRLEVFSEPFEFIFVNYPYLKKSLKRILLMEIDKTRCCLSNEDISDFLKKHPVLVDILSEDSEALYIDI